MSQSLSQECPDRLDAAVLHPLLQVQSVCACGLEVWSPAGRSRSWRRNDPKRLRALYARFLEARAQLLEAIGRKIDSFASSTTAERLSWAQQMERLRDIEGERVEELKANAREIEGHRRALAASETHLPHSPLRFEATLGQITPPPVEIDRNVVEAAAKRLRAE
jgi:hypothetical protein